MARHTGRLRVSCVAAILLMSLGGCLAPGATGAGRAFRAAPDQPTRPAVQRVAFYDGEVVVSGPPGYCIDTDSAVRRGRSRFVLLASCASLGADDGGLVDPAVITVSVLPFDVGAEHPTAAQIAASQAPTPALALIDADGVSLVHLGVGGDAVVPGGDPRYWRAGMVINGHLLGIAAYTEEGGVLAGPAGRDVLINMAGALRALSPALRRVAEPPAAPTDAAKPHKSGAMRIGGLFRKPA